MKQKSIIMVSMPCEKGRRRAMELAAGATGVTSVRIIGDYADRLEVLGDDVDVICLVYRLRKKVGRADIVQVDELKDIQPEEKKKQEEKKKLEEEKKKEAEKEKSEETKLVDKKKPHPQPQCYPVYYNYCPPLPPVVIRDDEYNPSCSIM